MRDRIANGFLTSTTLINHELAVFNLEHGGQTFNAFARMGANTLIPFYFHDNILLDILKINRRRKAVS